MPKTDRHRKTAEVDEFSACPPNSPFYRIPTDQLIFMIATQMKSFVLMPEASTRSRLLLMPGMDLAARADAIVDNNMCEFCWSLCFHPHFLSDLFYQGFLPICSDIGGADEDGDVMDSALYILLPKLHRKRCVIPDVMRDLRIHKKVRKKANKYIFSVDSDFDSVVQHCQKQHGMAWLYPPIVHSLKAIHQRRRPVTSERSQRARKSSDMDKSTASSSSCLSEAPSSSQDPKVSLHSIEVRTVDTNELVAGELGCLVGACYTSLTGFFNPDHPGSGTVQMAALGAYLATEGLAKMWDLGMDIEYKRDLGASNLPRAEFVRAFRGLRDQEAPLDARQRPADGRNCREVIDAFLRRQIKND